MLKTKDYYQEIEELYKKGLCATEISKKLGFKYVQPVFNYFKKRGWKSVRTIYSRKYSLKNNFFNCIDTEEKAYILGFICADGHVENNRLKITLSYKDLDILLKIRRELKSNCIIKEVYRKNPYTKSVNTINKLYEISFNSVELVKPLIKMNIVGNKTYSLNGDITKFIPKNLIRHFLRGYFDGDGNVFYGKKYSSGYKYNINICGNLDFLLETFQKYFPVNNKIYKDLYSKQCYVWKISKKKTVEDFMHYLYDNSKIFLDRKYKEFRKIKCGHVKQG